MGHMYATNRDMDIQKETERWVYRQDSQTEREIDQINGHKDSQLDRKRARPD